MATSTHTTVYRRDIFVQKLQLTESFCGYVAEKVDGKLLANCSIKEGAGGSIFVGITYHVVGNKELSRRHLASGSTSKRKEATTKTQHSTQPRTFNTKKKTPSRIRRDRERFRRFVDRKTLLKKSVSKPVSPVVQCPPPPDIVITQSVTPPSLTLPKPPSVAPPSRPETVPPCNCDICRIFVDKLPFKDLYEVCDSCGKPNTEELTLRPCAQCLSTAYCCRQCQREAWKSKHKPICDKDTGVKIKRARETWNLAREVWLEHKQQPLSDPAI